MRETDFLGLLALACMAVGTAAMILTVFRYFVRVSFPRTSDVLDEAVDRLDRKFATWLE